MEKEEIFTRIYKEIKKYRDEGKIIKSFGPDGEIGIIGTEDLCQQGIEGLLYDLGLDEAVLATLQKDSPLEFANSMAISSVIIFLHKFYKQKTQGN